MALNSVTLRLIRAEIGQSISPEIDSDLIVEEIYNEEGNGSVLVTAYWIWKRRLGDLQHRSFDVTTGGSLLSRRQRMAFIQGRIAELEFSIGADMLARSHAANDEIVSMSTTNKHRSEFS